MHKHHIVPRHMGGTNDAANIINVTVEQHAELHLALYLEHGMLEDWLAYRGLIGIIGKEEIVKTIQSRPRTEEWKKRIGDSNRGKPRKQTYGECPHCNRKMRLCNLPMHISKHDGTSMKYSRMHTEESKAKMSAAAKGRIPWNKKKQ